MVACIARKFRRAEDALSGGDHCFAVLTALLSHDRPGDFANFWYAEYNIFFGGSVLR